MERQGKLLEVSGVSSFRTRAYGRAAEVMKQIGRLTVIAMLDSGLKMDIRIVGANVWGSELVRVTAHAIDASRLETIEESYATEEELYAA